MVATKRQVSAAWLVPWLVRKPMVRKVGAQEIVGTQNPGTQARYAENGRLHGEVTWRGYTPKGSIQVRYPLRYPPKVRLPKCRLPHDGQQKASTSRLVGTNGRYEGKRPFASNRLELTKTCAAPS